MDWYLKRNILENMEAIQYFTPLKIPLNHYGKYIGHYVMKIKNNPLKIYVNY